MVFIFPPLVYKSRRTRGTGTEAVVEETVIMEGGFQSHSTSFAPTSLLEVGLLKPNDVCAFGKALDVMDDETTPLPRETVNVIGGGGRERKGGIKGVIRVTYLTQWRVLIGD